jgi:stage V sporulation protein R
MKSILYSDNYLPKKGHHLMRSPSIIVQPGSDWTFDNLHQVYDEIEEIGLKEMGYNIYTNQVEVIRSEQMLDAYASIGMPIFYKHWSFGKHYVKNREMYQTGMQNLAYEIVINSDPCIVYIMEENSLLMQTLVMAHAGIGHNHFFKNNNLFTDWTTASNIIDYLEFARNFVAKCEEKYGITEVEKILDAAHALMHNGVFRHKHKEPLSLKKELKRQIDRAVEKENTYNDIWRTVPKDNSTTSVTADELKKRQKMLHLPEENILYFLEVYSPILKEWQREILRIVRNVAQYFYPQQQTQIMNEGCATWTHYTILNRLYDKGFIADGAMFEFLKSHTNVVTQLPFDHPFYHGINPYALGFAMMQDICRICNDPTEEDREFRPDIAGCKDHFNVLKDTWANYRDESFIRQYLSPRIIRDFKLFTLYNDTGKDHYLVKNIHNKEGYDIIRKTLADECTLSNNSPSIDVWDVNITGDRELKLKLVVNNGRDLHEKDANAVVKYIANLWGYDVRLQTVSEAGALMTTFYKTSDNKPTPEPNYDVYCSQL